MAFKVCSWNLLHGNKRVIRALNYIMGSGVGADVICLQEVQENVLYQLSHSREYDFFHACDLYSKLGQAYLGILVRKELASRMSHRVAVHNDMRSTSPMGKTREWTAFQESHSIRIGVDGHIVEIINVHMDANGSILERITNLDRVLNTHHRNADARILCGDLNPYGCWWKNGVAALLFGLPWSELRVDEKRLLDELLDRHGLEKVFAWRFKHITHFTTFGQLDHIICTKGVFRIDDPMIMPAIHNSDHSACSAVFSFRHRRRNANGSTSLG